MNANASKRMKKIGIPKIKDPQLSGEMIDFEVPGIPSPAEERLHAAVQRDERYLRKVKEMKARIRGDRRRGIADYIRSVTDDGADLVLFALEVLRTDEAYLDGCEVDLKAKIWAVEYLTDRAFGKAVNTIKVDSTIHNVSDEEIVREINLIKERLGEKPIDVECKQLAEGEDNGEQDEGIGTAEGLAEGEGAAGENEPDSEVPAL